MQQTTASSNATAVVKRLTWLTCRREDGIHWNYDFFIPLADVPGAANLGQADGAHILQQFGEVGADIAVVADASGQPCFEIHHHKMRGQTQI